MAQQLLLGGRKKRNSFPPITDAPLQQSGIWSSTAWSDYAGNAGFCPPPSVNVRASSRCSQEPQGYYKVGSICMSPCPPGYEGKDDVISLCSTDGTWETRFPCEASPSVSSLPSKFPPPTPSSSSSSPLSSSPLSSSSSSLLSSSSATSISSSILTIPPTTHLQSSQTSTQASSSSSGSNTIMASELGLYIGVGVGGGILVFIVVILMIVVIIRCRGSNDKASTDGRNTLEMRPGPEGSDWDNRPPATSPNDYSLGTGHTNTAANGLTGVEDSTYSMIAEADMDPRNNAPNSSAYEDVPPLDSTSGSRRPPQPAPRKSVKEAQDILHPDASELYSKPKKDQLKNRQPNSLPEYAVLEKEPIGQEDVEVPPSALNPEDIAGLYTMPDKSKKSTNGLHRSGTALDNALYICRGEADGAKEASEYAIDKNDAKVRRNEQADEDTEMIENELYETSDRYA